MKATQYKIGFCIVMFIGSLVNLFGQDSVQIGGLVIDSLSTNPLGFATLLVEKDTKQITGTIGAEDGSFLVSLPNQEGQSLIIKHIGYQDKRILLPIKASGGSLQLGNIHLIPQDYTVDVVEIEAQKSLFSLGQNGAILFNIAGSTLSGIGSAADLVERTPGVTLDIGGNIVLNGQQGVLVKIDGRDIRMSGAELQSYLKSLNSQDIDQIEIIQNPSASYDASGAAGIINIKTKKSREKGFGGRANLSGNYGQNLRYRGGINTNWRLSDKVNLNTRANISRGKTIGDLDEQRLIKSTQENLIRSNDRLYSYSNQTLNVGLDINASDQHFIGIVFDLYNENNQDQTQSQTNLYQQNVLQSRVDFDSDGKLTWTNYNTTLTHNWTMDTSGTEIVTVVDYGNYTTDGRFDMQSDFYNAAGIPSTDPISRRTTNPNLIDLWSIKSDFSTERPGFYLEAGYKISYVKADNDFKALRLQNEEWTNVENQSNHFLFNETIYAGYVGAAREFIGLNWYAGLRYEHSISVGNSITIADSFRRTISQPFPSFSVSKSIKDLNVSASYSRRISRPDYQALNPFEFYLDEYSFWKGNPSLLPQTTHSLSSNINYKSRLNVSLVYSHNDNLIMPVAIQDDATKRVFTTRQNIGSSDYFGMFVSHNATIAKRWTLYHNGGIYYNSILDETNDIGTITKGLQGYYLNSSHSISLPKKYSIEATLAYNGPNVSIWRSEAYFSLALGARKRFKNNSTLNLRVSDALNTILYQNSYLYENVEFTNQYKPETFRISLAFSYAFGNQKIQLKKKESGLQEEKDRINRQN